MMRPAAVLGLLGVLAGGASGQARLPARPAPVVLDCKACHTAKTPTKEDPALRACPRLLIKGYHSVDEAPATMTLGAAAAVYGPVKFSHRAHAKMAETGQGCAGCHHYDQAGPIQECGACHSATRARTDLDKPDVKAAIHRQCLECHREWDGPNKCGSCHVKPAGAAAGNGLPSTVHPLTPKAPARVVYQTPAVAGETVTFFHSDHVERFGLECSSCHQQERCSTCHRVKAGGPDTATTLVRASRPGRTTAEAHARCSTCHVNAPCATCHASSGPRVAGFDHRASAGWPLNRFHAPLACARCHTTPGRFTRLSTDCGSCHTTWPAGFDHRKTGLALDETHASLDCVSCHEDKTFSAPPVCTSCHDDKAYPADKPGKKVSGMGTRK
jgi:hypothetical protein